MDFSQFGNAIAQEASRGGMRTTSTMQRPGDIAANLRARERRGKRRGNRGGGQLSAEDLISLFQSMPTPNRGFRRPGGDKPDFLGGGLDAFYAKNPHIAQGPARAEQIAQERQQQLSRGFDAGRAAVDFAKQTKGYTDAQGNFVPPTMPNAPSSNFGTGSVAFTDKPTRGTMTDYMGRQVSMDEFLPEQSLVGDTKYGAMPKPATQPIPTRSAQAAQPQNDMTALFPGSAVRPMNVAAEAPKQPLPIDTPGQASVDARKSGLLANLPPLTQNGIIPDLWDSGNAFLMGLGDLYSNNVGRPLDQLLFGIQPPAQPSNNMQQYQKSRGQKQGWW